MAHRKRHWNRRDAVRAGALSAPGLSLSQLLQSQVHADPVGSCFGRAKNIIFLYLAGGPPQHETFDPKPQAPVEVRGPFSPISTNVPGIQYSELLPRTAAMASRIAIIRSMATDDNIHSSSGAWVLTGYRYRGANARQINETDWPYFGSQVKRWKPSEQMPALSTVWLPDVMRLNENVTPAGQTAGFMGPQWNPEVFVGDPSAVNYEIESLRASGIPSRRMGLRHDLLQQLDASRRLRGGGAKTFDTFQQQAFDLLTSGRARRAFNVADEPDHVRNRYGRNRWGQCVLLARRLVEAGVRLVHVQWPREPGDNASDNPLWDTHAQNADRVEDVLCPMFDVGYTALLEDLEQRGLLDETLVVAVGEFGRTPKINAKGGRDHWGPVFSCALAGAGISGGQTFGASDRDGAYPVEDRVEPGDLTATMFHLVGMDYTGTFPDRLGREQRLTSGEPIWKLIGEQPANRATQPSGGNILRVPAYDPEQHLAQIGFGLPLKPASSPSRPKGWRADPLLGRTGFGCSINRSVKPAFAEIGVHAVNSQVQITRNTAMLLGQEVRSPFPGTYTIRIRARQLQTAAAVGVPLKYELQFLRFADQAKNITEATLFAGIEFTPTTDWREFEFAHRFINPTPGGNFSYGSGLCVAVRVTSTGDAVVPAGGKQLLQVESVKLMFAGKEVNDKVTV